MLTSMHKHRSSSGIVCQYCNNFAELVTGDVIYPGVKKLRNLPYWLCKICSAYVGCKPGTTVPTNQLADEAERERRKTYYQTKYRGKEPPPKPL